MFKRFSRFIIGLALILAIVFISSNKTEASLMTMKTFIVNEQVFGFEYAGGKSIIYNSFAVGEEFGVIGETATHFLTPFGNGYVLVDKMKVSLTSRSASLDTKRSENSYVTKGETTVYSSNSNVLGTIRSDVRIPILQEVSGYYQIVFGGKHAYISKDTVQEDVGIPTLMYHHMLPVTNGTPYANNAAVITVEQFENEMNYLSQSGWTTIHLDELEDWLDLNKNLPAKVVVITFDDGIVSTAKYAYPILKQHGMKAISFIITSRIHEEAEPWDSDELQFVGKKEMIATNDVFSYQHHTHYMHASDGNQSMLQTASYEDIKLDIITGIKQIEEALGQQNVRYLAYPFGMYNDNSIRAAKDSGITMAYTVQPGNVKLGANKYLLPRHLVGPNDSLDDLRKRLSGTK